MFVPKIFKLGCGPLVQSGFPALPGSSEWWTGGAESRKRNLVQLNMVCCLSSFINKQVRIFDSFNFMHFKTHYSVINKKISNYDKLQFTLNLSTQV